MAIELAGVHGWCLGAMLVAGCIRVDRHPASAPDATETTATEVTITDDALEATVADTATPDAPDLVASDTVPSDGEVVGTEVLVADTPSPDAVEVTACDGDQCAIDGACYDRGAHRAGAADQICDPSCSKTTWVPDCGALECLKDPYCDGGKCLAPDDMDRACFVAAENRCYSADEQTEGTDWPDGANTEDWPDLERNTPYEASLNPLGESPNGNAGADVDWVRWTVTSGLSAVESGVNPLASARLLNDTGAHVEFCVLVACGSNGSLGSPATMTCSEGAKPWPRVDDTRSGCCLIVSPEEAQRKRTLWARPTCLPGVTQQLAFARVAAPSADGNACGRYELSFDLDAEDISTP